MSIPLYGFLKGDTAGLLVLAEEDETILELAGKLQDAASIRVAPYDDFDVVCNGKALGLEMTVSQAGFAALDRFDVVRRERL